MSDNLDKAPLSKLFGILGVPSDAYDFEVREQFGWALKDVEQRYRILMRTAHPDKGGDHETSALYNRAIERIREIAAKRGVVQRLIVVAPEEPPVSSGVCSRCGEKFFYHKIHRTKRQTCLRPECVAGGGTVTPGSMTWKVLNVTGNGALTVDEILKALPNEQPNLVRNAVWTMTHRKHLIVLPARFAARREVKS